MCDCCDARKILTSASRYHESADRSITRSVIEEALVDRRSFYYESRIVRTKRPSPRGRGDWHDRLGSTHGRLPFSSCSHKIVHYLSLTKCLFLLGFRPSSPCRFIRLAQTTNSLPLGSAIRLPSKQYAIQDDGAVEVASGTHRGRRGRSRRRSSRGDLVHWHTFGMKCAFGSWNLQNVFVDVEVRQQPRRR